MFAGPLDRRISIERAAISRDEFNAPVEVWSEMANVWASKTDIKDRERYRGDATSSEITTRFQLRYSAAVADVSPKDRVIFAGRVYDIVAVKEIGRREGIEITGAARND